jgi:hypothetical protein
MAIWFFSANSRRVSSRMHGELLDLPLQVRRRRETGEADTGDPGLDHLILHPVFTGWTILGPRRQLQPQRLPT